MILGPYEKMTFFGQDPLIKIILQSTMRERLRKMTTLVKLHCKSYKKVEEREGGRFQRTSAAQCFVHCTAIYFILFPPLVIIICCNPLCFFICNWKMLIHVCTCALVGWGLSNKSNLTWQNILACSYYLSHEWVANAKSSSVPSTAPTVCLLRQVATSNSYLAIARYFLFCVVNGHGARQIWRWAISGPWAQLCCSYVALP